MSDPHVLWLNADDGEPAYHAEALRQAFSMFLTHHGTDRFGARAGLHPMGGVNSAADVTGFTWRLAPSVGVVYPAVTSEVGPYVVVIPETQGSVSAADAANPRRDLLYLRVYDDDIDASGQRRAVIEYRTGNPASNPSRPATPAGTLPILDIRVPAPGAGNPTATQIYPITVAAGGVLPVRNANDIDETQLHLGQTIWRTDLNTQLSRQSNAWIPTSNCVQLDDVSLSGQVDIGTSLSIPVSLRQMFRSFEIVIQGGVTTSNEFAPIIIRPNNNNTESYRSTATAMRADGTVIQASELNNTAWPRVGFMGRFSPSVMTTRFVPRTRGTTSFITWTTEGWMNWGASGSATVRAGGRANFAEAEILTRFLVRTNFNADVWTDGTTAQLYGYR